MAMTLAAESLCTTVEQLESLEPWLDKRHLAEYFDCSVRSIELAIKEGMPHRVLFGRVKAKPSEVEAWLDGVSTIDPNVKRPGSAINTAGPDTEGVIFDAV